MSDCVIKPAYLTRDQLDTMPHRVAGRHAVSWQSSWFEIVEVTETTVSWRLRCSAIVDVAETTETTISFSEALGRVFNGIARRFGRANAIERYAEYLKSDHWRFTREKALQRAGYLCENPNCTGRSARLQVHHLTYERVGKELPGDLQVLCSDCHADEHDL